MGPEGCGVIVESRDPNGGAADRRAGRYRRAADSGREAVAYRSTVPQVMHACGHDVHTATVFGALSALDRLERERRAALAGDVARHFSAGRGNGRRRGGDDRAPGRWKASTRSSRCTSIRRGRPARSACGPARSPPVATHARDGPRPRRPCGPAARIERSDRRRGRSSSARSTNSCRARPTARTRSSCRSARSTAARTPT